jgi:hypothetical protein
MDAGIGLVLRSRSEFQTRSEVLRGVGWSDREMSANIIPVQ